MKHILIILALLGTSVLIAYAHWLPELTAVAVISILAITYYTGILVYRMLSQTKNNNTFIKILKWLLCYSVLIVILGYNLITIAFRSNHIDTVTLSNKTFYLYHDGWFGDDIYEVRTTTNVFPITSYVLQVYNPGIIERPKITQKGHIIFCDSTKIYDLKTNKIMDQQLDNLLRNKN